MKTTVSCGPLRRSRCSEAATPACNSSTSTGRSEVCRAGKRLFGAVVVLTKGRSGRYSMTRTTSTDRTE
eukprot:3655779-Alexandrium_andersonii.AAC.1